MKAAALRKRPASQPVTTRQKNPAGRDWLRSLDRVWRAMSSPAPHACVPLIEEFEPRLLYSADFAASGLALAADCQVTEQRVLDDSGEFIQNQTSQTNVTEQQHELIIIDASVPDIDGLVAGLDTNGRSIEIVILDAGKDGIKQISAALAGRTDLSAVHIFSHGSDATLQLGSTTLNNSQLDARSGEIARWGDSLSGDGDILLYGCDVAQSEDGRALIDTLARLTGADVAASEDVTGNVLLGGNWNLEYSKGTIEVNLALTRQAQLDWSGLLNVATLQSAQDTYIVSATGNNYGASASLNFDASAGGLGNQRLLLQFDLSSIPAGATINSASLQMQATAITGGPVNLEVHEVLQAWTEGAANGTAGAANWNERIAATNWTTAGGDFNAVAAATLNTGVTGQHSWDITALAQAWYGGTANNGIIVGSPDGGGATVTYDSKEGATAPQLVIDYTPAANNAPIIAGITATTNINDTATATPFSAVTIGDVDNPAQMQSVSITLDLAAKGTLSNLGGGAYDAGTGVYSFSGTAAAATTAVQGLVFTPAANRVTPGSTETTTFTISVSDGIAAAVTNNATTITSSNVTFPPPPTPAPPEPASPPPVVENTVTAADTEPITQNSKEIEPLPIEAKASDVSATTTSLLEEKSLSAASTSASELAKSQGSREGVRANLNPANAAALFNLDPAMLAEFQIGKRGDLPLFDAVTSATENHAFINELDQLRENITADAEREKHIIGASVAAGTGLSIGYVLWLLRGGVLLSSLLSALPAWRFVDPLPVLGRLKDGDDNEDDEAGYDESLESLVIEQPNKEHATPEENKNA